jgi:hypothetical protein
MCLCHCLARLGFAVFFIQIAQADVMTFLSGSPDFIGLWGTQDGLGFRAMSFGLNPHYNSSNPQFPTIQVGDATMNIGTGPLISSTATSWTFEGGTLLIGPGTLSGLIPSPPPGYSTCEDAGYITYFGGCAFAAELDGTLTGDVTLSLSGIVGYGSDAEETYSIRQYQLTGSVLFDINSDLALAAGVTTGPYLGWFVIDGSYLHGLAGDPGFLDEPYPPDVWHSINIRSIEVTGASVPEPSSIALLVTVVGAMGLAFRRKQLSRHGPEA